MRNRERRTENREWERIATISSTPHSAFRTPHWSLIPRSSFLVLSSSFLLLSGCAPLLRPSTIENKPAPAISPLPADGAPLKAAPTTGPEAAKLSLTVADGMEKSGHYRDAALQLELAKKHDPSLNLHARLARLYHRAGEAAGGAEQSACFKKALEEYGQAQAKNGATAELLNDLGCCQMKAGQLPEAERSFRQALALDAKLARARNNLGLTLGQQGKFKEAYVEFCQVVNPAEAHCNVAFLHAKAGNAAAAAAEYQQALAKNPNLDLARAGLAALEKIETTALSAKAAAGTTAPPALGMPTRR